MLCRFGVGLTGLIEFCKVSTKLFTELRQNHQIITKTTSVQCIVTLCFFGRILKLEAKKALHIDYQTPVQPVSSHCH